MAELEFHGAAQTVTGSMHLLHLRDGPVALDCGLFQGRREEIPPAQPAPSPCPRSELAGLLLSHAHIDHSGNIPGLVRQGFPAPIYATRGHLRPVRRHAGRLGPHPGGRRPVLEREACPQRLRPHRAALHPRGRPAPPRSSAARWPTTAWQEFADGATATLDRGRAHPRLGLHPRGDSPSRARCTCCTPATWAAWTCPSSATRPARCRTWTTSSPSAPTPTAATPTPRT